MEKIFLIIDCRHDFLYDGKFDANGSTEKMDELTNYIEEHRKDYNCLDF